MADLEMKDAEFHVISVNELGLDQKQSVDIPGQPQHDDPVGLGFGAWANPLGRLKWYIGKIRFDVLRWVDKKVHRTEVGFLKIAVDELYDNDGVPLPHVAIFLTRDVHGSADSDEQPVMIWTRNGIRVLAPLIIEAGVNIAVPNVAPPPVTPPSCLTNGAYQLHLQGDRNMVLYDTSVDPWVAVWNSGTQV